MSDLEGYGKIYETTYWGDGRDNTIGWGIVYKDLGVTTDADYQAVLDDATNEGFDLPSASQQVHQNTLVTDLKSAGVWDLLEGLWVYANDADTPDFATYNWIDADATRATINNAIVHADDGFTSASGTIGSIDTNHIAGSSSKFQQYSASWGVYSNTAFSTASGNQYANQRFRYPNNSSGGNRIMSAGLSATPSSTIGLMGMQKVGDGEIQGLQADGSFTNLETGQGDAELSTLQVSNLKYVTTNYSGNVGLCWVGDQFTLAQWSAFVTAVDTYIANKDS